MWHPPAVERAALEKEGKGGGIEEVTATETESFQLSAAASQKSAQCFYQ